MLIAAGLFVVFVVLAYSRPVITMLLLLLLGPLWMTLQTTQFAQDLAGFAIAGARPVDVLEAAMLSVVCIRAPLLLLSQERRFPSLLRWSAVLLASWMVFEVARNVGVCGIAALGEFRFLYLMLVVPLYVSLMFVTAQLRRRLFRLTVFAATVASLALVPVILLLNGWGFGADNRVFPACLSLGMGLAWTAVYLARRVESLRVNSTSLWILAAVVFAVILNDGHRSVWLVMVALLLTLLVLGDIPVHLTRWRTVSAWVGVAFLALLMALGALNPLPYVANRAQAFISPKQDVTANWRIQQWRAALPSFYREPLAGEGFGAYWDEGVNRGGAGVTPHSIYVQSLVKLGSVGVLLLLTVAACATRLLWRTRRAFAMQHRSREMDAVLVLMGLLSVIAALVYGVAYSLEYYTLIFIGLGVGAAVYGERPDGGYS